MKELTAQIRETAKKLLADKTVDLVLGWVKGDDEFVSAPRAFKTPESVDQLVFDEFCIHDLANFLLDYRDGHEKIGILVKGCDSRGVVRLIQDRAINRDRLYIIGIPCPGMKDPNEYLKQDAGIGKGVSPSDVAQKCRGCQTPNPVLADVTIGAAQPARTDGERLALVQSIEAMTPEERYAFFEKEMSKCLRCYACRNICIACNCRSCVFDETRPQWVGRATDPVNNLLYQLVRCSHVAGRCVECGECERACPVGIPLMLINRKIIKDVDHFFGPYQAGMSLEDDARPPLSRYKIDDPDEFM